MVPGHEIAGVVTAVGGEVTKYAVGDRVGVGCFVDSCRECETVARAGAVLHQRGNSRHLQRVGTDGEPTYGGYSAQIVVDENYVLRIPDGSRSTSPRRCSAPASPPTRRCGTGTPAPARRSRSSASAGSGTWA